MKKPESGFHSICAQAWPVGSAKGTSKASLTGLKRTDRTAVRHGWSSTARQRSPAFGRWDHVTFNLRYCRIKTRWPLQDPLSHRWLRAPSKPGLARLQTPDLRWWKQSLATKGRAGSHPQLRSLPHALGHTHGTFYIAQSSGSGCFSNVFPPASS